MKKYKVEFIETQRYIVDVLAKNEQEATDKASEKWKEIVKSGMAHYHNIDEEYGKVGTVYDVTNTDDPFNP